LFYRKADGIVFNQFAFKHFQRFKNYVVTDLSEDLETAGKLIYHVPQVELGVTSWG
jgi:hypothetical protein